MNHYKHWTNQEKASCLFDALQNKDILHNTLELIQGWLVSDDNAQEKDIRLNLVLDSNFEQYVVPGRRTYELLASAHKRLGLPKVRVPQSPHVILLRKITSRVAAVILPLIIITSLMLLIDKNNDGSAIPEEQVVIASASGSPEIISLPDGSTARITEGSEFHYADNFMRNRLVKLKGEAFFSIERMGSKPFVVETENLTVTVLGTEFNLKAFPDDAETTVALISGEVEVEHDNVRLKLAPMERLRYDNVTRQADVTTLDPSDINTLKTGTKELNDMPLAEALKAVGEFFGKNISIDNGLPPDKSVTTILRETSSAESTLKAMMLVCDSSFSYEISGDDIYIRGK